MIPYFTTNYFWESMILKCATFLWNMSRYMCRRCLCFFMSGNNQILFGYIHDVIANCDWLHNYNSNSFFPLSHSGLWDRDCHSQFQTYMFLWRPFHTCLHANMYIFLSITLPHIILCQWLVAVGISMYFRSVYVKFPSLDITFFHRLIWLRKITKEKRISFFPKFMHGT